MKIPKLFKKAAAFVMAAVTALSIMPATAFAAGDIGTISFSHTYDSNGNAMRYNSSANIGGYTAGGTGNYKYRMFVDGENAFCIQPGVPLKTGNTLKKASSDTWNALSANQKKAVGLALLYGYQGNRNNLSGSDDEKWLATQTLVWEFVTGCREATGSYNQTSTTVYSLHLKGIGVEVFFIDDNIWTMDGDGELRLSLMATLAQEESRKTSERVKAGQKISRDNGVLYGNGNILGYDRVGDTYVINEEQAETVRMIYDLYLQGYGSMKIAKILTERKRKTASGLIKWSVSNIMRAIKNATYTGTKCYNKSRSNNFLEQKRINNLDMSTYEYVEGDFPAIISQEIWDKAQAIRESRVKPVCVSAGKNTHSKRDSRDIWVNKLRCSCGSSYRKNKWHTKLDGKTSYGYQCYNQLNNGIKRKRAEIGLDTEGYCDSRMITDWKLDFMAKALLEHLWTERKESVLIALDLIKCYYKEEKSNETQSDTVTIQAKLDKANSRLTNLIAMRADGEISKDEYQAMRSPVDEEIKKLQKALDEIPQEKSNPKGLDIEGIRSTLNSLVDFSGSTISHDVVNQFVYLITPTSDTTFDWYVNLNGTADVKATFTAEGRKKNCIIKLEEIEKISSVHRGENEDNAHFIKNPHIFTYLHRQQLLRRTLNYSC